MDRKARQYSNAEIRGPELVPNVPGNEQDRARARGFVIAWAFALIFYFLEYAVRSSPSVMIPQLAAAFRTTALGVGSILVLYYYTYSITSLVAGAALDHMGAKRPVPVGAAILGAGCLLFSVSSVMAADVGRLLQGVGSAFAFTGAVYLAARGFPPSRLATAIGATQCLGMLGGAAGQFAVAPMIERGLVAKTFWIGMGVLCLINAVLLYMATPREQLNPDLAGGGVTELVRPYKVVFSNPQSYLCGIVAGLLFAPTTIGAMIWAVPIFEKDVHFTHASAVLTASMVAMGWVVGCPLLGWISDRIGRRKPVIIGGAAIMALTALTAAVPERPLIPLVAGMFIFGVASGAAMIPYSVIKEVNPDEVKGSATGAINFLVFGITAAMGPYFAKLFAKSLETTTNHLAHFQQTIWFWIACCIAAAIVSTFLRETGPATHAAVAARS
jgi:MFS family permease